ncbi:MAG: S53 family peptidase [Acidobacteriaceae bacterium]
MPETRTALVDPQFRMNRMVLLLRPPLAAQQSLDALVAAQHDPESSRYHQWLSPAEYGDWFGVSASASSRIASWLVAQGFHVDQIAPNRRMIVFSGTAGAVDAAFHTEMIRYQARDVEHVANAAGPVIPAEFAGEVAGIVGLNDRRSTPAHTPMAAFTAGSTHYLSPADVAVIYDVAPLYAQGISGKGAAIAVLARSSLLPQDIADFRSAFGLPENPPAVIVNGDDPGIGNRSDWEETELDAEWAGALAPQAAVDVVVSASTPTTDGILLSAEYAVDHNLAPVIALSYAECEADLGAAGNTMIDALWEQAASEGMTVIVAAGDSGAAGCDDPADDWATHGRAVNGLCSSPFSLCVGGTELADDSDAYWAVDNDGIGESAHGYIPEITWNQSGASSGGLWAGGGGVSSLYARPAWQPDSGDGAESMREVPDLSLTSSSHDSCLLWFDGAQVADSGTSAAAQVMGGILALAVARRGERLGNPAPELYALAASRPAIFHDVTAGNNSVPGEAGFPAVPGFDLATGLGSVNAALLVDAWRGLRLVRQRPRCAASRNCGSPPIGPRALATR